ncbi:AAA family ATPase [Kribbella sp. NPDC056951]|uniref:AAA family ATPase n=1 Tax=Kribbella sp. NPDC056951 TaxID=3345978 RepID=UPI0036387CF4
MVNSPSITGIGICRYRDIREPAYIGPLAQMNVLGGVNNAGKSSILDAVYAYFPPLNAPGQARSIPLDKPAGLDEPQLPSLNGFKVGYEIDFGAVDGLSVSFLEAISGVERTLTHEAREVLDKFLRQPGLMRPGQNVEESTARWIWGVPGVGDHIFEEFANTVTEPDKHLADSALNIVTSVEYTGDHTWKAVFHRLLTQAAGGPTQVVHIPPVRRILASQHKDISLPGNNGEGLPGMLLSLLAPKAQEFRKAKDRLFIINEFLKLALGRASAELLVPYDADTVHVALEDRVLPLSHLGAGIEQLVLLATVCTAYQDALVLIEEPELFMHPTLQRQFVGQLMNMTNNKYVMTTHSAALLDTDVANVFKVDWSQTSGTTMELVSSPNARAMLATSLGFRASDLVQANAIIWVEGPSDRIYLKRWLALADPSLFEGVHYSFIMYGGRLAEHLSAVDGEQGQITEESMDRFLNIVRINRNAVFVMDSDLTSESQPLAGYKERIVNEIATHGNGLAWVTFGVMIENYLTSEQFSAAYEKVHTRTKVAGYDGGMDANPFSEGVKQPDKVRIAQVAVSEQVDIPDRGDLHARLNEVTAYIRKVNGMHPLAQMSE